jgi:ferredoxin-type protein NapH
MRDFPHGNPQPLVVSAWQWIFEEFEMKNRQKLRKGLIVGMFLLFPVTIYYFSPVLFLQGAAMGLLSGSAIVFGLQFLSSLVLGRAFCGWVCPAAGLQEIAISFRDRRVRRKRIRWIKFVIWVPWFLFSVFLLLQAGGIREVNPIWRTKNGVSVSDIPSLIVYLLIVSLFVLLSAIIGRRAGCHTICWMAPFMVVGRKIRNILAWPSLRLRTEKQKCIQCERCTKACPMSIEVMDLVQGENLETQDCILCGSCADACPKDVIHFAFKPGK